MPENDNSAEHVLCTCLTVRRTMYLAFGNIIETFDLYFVDKHLVKITSIV